MNGNWVEINKKEDHEFLGFSGDNRMLLFRGDFKTLPFAAKNRAHFISGESQLTARGSQMQKVLADVDGV